LDAGTAHLHASNICSVFDAFTVPNSLTPSHPLGNIVSAVLNSLDIRWSGVTRSIIGFSDPANQFSGDFFQIGAVGHPFLALGAASGALIAVGPAYVLLPLSEQARAQRAKASVLKTEGTGWDIGHAVRFLLSAHARYITGHVLVVDGGVTLQGPERDSVDH